MKFESISRKTFIDSMNNPWYKFLLWSRILRIDINLEECPAGLADFELDEDGNRTMLINLVAEPKWFWQR